MITSVAILLGMLFVIMMGELLINGNTAKDVNKKCEEFVWYTDEAKKDIQAYIMARKGKAVRQRIMIEALKKNLTLKGKDFYDAMDKVRSITPPNMILAHLYNKVCVGIAA